MADQLLGALAGPRVDRGIATLPRVRLGKARHRNIVLEINDDEHPLLRRALRQHLLQPRMDLGARQLLGRRRLVPIEGHPGRRVFRKSLRDVLHRLSLREERRVDDIRGIRVFAKARPGRLRLLDLCTAAHPRGGAQQRSGENESDCAVPSDSIVCHDYLRISCKRTQSLYQSRRASSRGG